MPSIHPSYLGNSSFFYTPFTHLIHPTPPPSIPFITIHPKLTPFPKLSWSAPHKTWSRYDETQRTPLNQISPLPRYNDFILHISIRQSRKEIWSRGTELSGRWEHESWTVPKLVASRIWLVKDTVSLLVSHVCIYSELVTIVGEWMRRDLTVKT